MRESSLVTSRRTSPFDWRLSLLRSSLQLLWFVITPLTMSGVVLRYLTPYSITAGGLEAAFARFAHEHTLLLALLLFVSLAALFRYWRAFLPGAVTLRSSFGARGARAAAALGALRGGRRTAGWGDRCRVARACRFGKRGAHRQRRTRASSTIVRRKVESSRTAHCTICTVRRPASDMPVRGRRLWLSHWPWA